jgi:hypothetical protein
VSVRPPALQRLAFSASRYDRALVWSSGPLQIVVMPEIKVEKGLMQDFHRTYQLLPSFGFTLTTCQSILCALFFLCT